MGIGPNDIVFDEPLMLASSSLGLAQPVSTHRMINMAISRIARLSLLGSLLRCMIMYISSRLESAKIFTAAARRVIVYCGHKKAP